MSKWRTVFTNRPEVTGPKAGVARVLAKSANKPSYEDMEKANEELFKAKVAKEKELVALYNEKKLKSKALIKKAKAIKNRKEKRPASTETDKS